MIQPKPCPLCGTLPNVYKGGRKYYVECNNLECTLNIHTCRNDEEEAIRVWNTRDHGPMVTAEHHRETISEIEERFRGLVAEHEKLTTSMTAIKLALAEFRNAVLEERHQLEAPCLDNDQTNAVLGLFDDTFQQFFPFEPTTP